MKKRILSVLMVLCLVLAAVPTALAEGEDSGVTPEDPAAPTEVIGEPGNEQQGGGEPAGTLPTGETPEEDSGEKTPANGPTTPAPEETSVPEEQVSPQDVGDTPTVEMDNLLVRLTSSPVRMSYTIEPAEAADEIEFVELMQDGDGSWVENTDGSWGIAAGDRKVSLYSGSDGIYRVTPAQQVVGGGRMPELSLDPIAVLPVSPSSPPPTTRRNRLRRIAAMISAFLSLSAGILSDLHFLPYFLHCFALK